MKVEVIEDSLLPQAIIPEWEALLPKSPFPNPFLTPTWNEIWMRHFGKDLQIKVILLRETGGGLVGLGTFAEFHGNGRNKLKLLGSTDVYDYRDILIDGDRGDETLGQFARIFAEGPWTEIELSGISEFSPTIRLLPPILRLFHFQVTEVVEEVSVYLNLPPTWEEFLARLDSKDRHELRRKMRRLEREASFEISDTGEGSSLAERMEVFLDLHRKSRKDKAEFMTPAMESFFQEIAERFQKKGWLTLPLLRVEGKEVAAFFSFWFQGTEYVYNSGYDPEFGRWSPGIVLAARCIGRAIERGDSRFHFLRGREDYKYHLGGKEEKIYQIRAVRK